MENIKFFLIFNAMEKCDVFFHSETSKNLIIDVNFILFSSYLRCQNRTICQGTAKLLHDASIIDLHPHSEFCRPDPQKELIAQFKEALAESLSQHWYRLRPLYDSLAAVYVFAKFFV